MRILSSKITQLQEISRQIAWYEEESRKSVRLALEYKLEIGKRLARAKALLSHGRFLKWAHNEFGWTPRHVQYHLLLAAHEKSVSLMPKGASVRMALAAIKELSAGGENRRTSSNGTRDEGSADRRLEVLPLPRQIHIIGEVVEGTLDCSRLVKELAHLAAEFGVPKSRWKIR
jgi:hypothetical protein